AIVLLQLGHREAARVGDETRALDPFGCASEEILHLLRRSKAGLGVGGEGASSRVESDPFANAVEYIEDGFVLANGVANRVGRTHRDGVMVRRAAGRIDARVVFAIEMAMDRDAYALAKCVDQRAKRNGMKVARGCERPEAFGVSAHHIEG